MTGVANFYGAGGGSPGCGAGVPSASRQTQTNVPRLVHAD